jgi:hypothetical protein
MEWDGVRIFLAVARGGQRSAAAKSLGLTHAIVGRQLIGKCSLQDGTNLTVMSACLLPDKRRPLLCGGKDRDHSRVCEVAGLINDRPTRAFRKGSRQPHAGNVVVYRVARIIRVRENGVMDRSKTGQLRQNRGRYIREVFCHDDPLGQTAPGEIGARLGRQRGNPYKRSDDQGREYVQGHCCCIFLDGRVFSYAARWAARPAHGE